MVKKDRTEWNGAGVGRTGQDMSFPSRASEAHAAAA